MVTMSSSTSGNDDTHEGLPVKHIDYNRIDSYTHICMSNCVSFISISILGYMTSHKFTP